MRVLVGVGVLSWLVVGCATQTPQAPVFQSGSARANLQLDLGDNGRTIGVESGAVFTVTLPAEQPDWQLTRAPEAAVASLVSRTRQDRQETWTFRGTGPGTTELELSRGAPEPFTLTVSVT